MTLFSLCFSEIRYLGNSTKMKILLAVKRAFEGLYKALSEGLSLLLVSDD